MKQEKDSTAGKKVRSQFASLMIEEAPHYANRFFYSLGFLAATSFLLLLISGMVEVFYGPTWWLTSGAGVFFRSVHMWATQAFVIAILLHLVIVFCTMGFRGPRRITWVLGVIMFFLVLMETEFGYALRGDFSTQWRTLQGADLYNGAGVGWWINPLNELKVLGLHTAIVPLVVLAVLVVHYALVRFLGIATPAKSDVAYKVEKANHTVLFLRGLGAVVVIVVLAIALPSPYLKAVTLQEVATSDPGLFAQTLVGEYGRLESIGQDPDTRDLTSGYMDSIQPYTFDTRKVYVEDPYAQLVASGKVQDALAPVEKLSDDAQKKLVDDAVDFFGANKGNVKEGSDPLISVAKTLTGLGAAGYYDSALGGYGEVGDNTYRLRLIADLGVLGDTATKLRMQTEQWGMLREEQRAGPAPGGSYPLAFSITPSFPPTRTGIATAR